MNKIILSIFLISLLFLAFLSCKEEPLEDNRVVARIAGELITEEDLNEQLDLLPPHIRSKYDTPEGREHLLEILIRQRILELAAKERGFDQRTDIRKKMEYAALSVLTQEFYQHYIDEGLWVPDKDLRNYYEEHKDDYKSPEKRVLSHIQHGTLSEIENIYDRLKNGEDFTTIVLDESQAFGAKDTNGFLAEIEKGNLDYSGILGDKKIIDIVFTLNEGEYTKPIRHTKGYSIIKIDRIIPPTQQSFEEAYGELASDYLLNDDVLMDYYTDNKDKFHQNEMIKVKYTFFATSSDALVNYNSLISGDITFNEAVQQSAIGDTYKETGGFENWLTRGSLIQGIGKDEEADEVIFSLNTGDYSKPYKSDKGYFIFQLLDKKEEGTKKFEEVKENILSQLILEEKSKASERAYEELIKRYDVVNYLSLGDYAYMKPDEILNKATSADDPLTSLHAYQAFITLYPDHPKAHKAKFLTGFIQSEDLKDYTLAKKTLEEFIVEYPNSEFYDDAIWILDSIESGNTGEDIIPLLND